MQMQWQKNCFPWGLSSALSPSFSLLPPLSLSHVLPLSYYNPFMIRCNIPPVALLMAFLFLTDIFAAAGEVGIRELEEPSFAKAVVHILELLQSTGKADPCPETD